MKPTRARRPHPAIREEKAGSNLKASQPGSGKRTRDDATDGWQNKPRGAASKATGGRTSAASSDWQSKQTEVKGPTARRAARPNLGNGKTTSDAEFENGPRRTPVRTSSAAAKPAATEGARSPRTGSSARVKPADGSRSPGPRHAPPSETQGSTRETGAARKAPAKRPRGGAQDSGPGAAGYKPFVRSSSKKTDGTEGAAKPAKTYTRVADGPAAGTVRPAGSKPNAPAGRAKKLLVRHGSQKEVAIQKQLRAKRLTTDQVGDERLQKVLAFSGWGSRREAETWIAEGRVTVNGKVAELGSRIKQGDEVRVDDKRVNLRWADRLPRIVIYHKQEGELVTRDDPQGRTTVFERLPKLASSKWIAIGRLDFNTSGLLLFTTSGDLANYMTHPSFEIEREYAVRVMGEITPEQMNEMTKGIQLEDGEAHFDFIEDQGGEGINHWYRVILREGRNREVRRMFEHYELTVSRLMRVRFGMFGLPARLKRGQFYELNETEVLAALKWADLRLNGVAKDF